MPTKKWSVTKLLSSLFRDYGMNEFRLNEALRKYPGSDKALQGLFGLGFLQTWKKNGERWYRLRTPEMEDVEDESSRPRRFKHRK